MSSSAGYPRSWTQGRQTRTRNESVRLRGSGLRGQAPFISTSGRTRRTKLAVSIRYPRCPGT